MKSDQVKHHEHDENCGCGCHDEHHHDHHCETEHQQQSEHHHHHEHKPITVTTHDMSIVGSYTFRIEKSYQEAAAILDGLLKQVAKEVVSRGGIIGHIKAVLASEGESCMISITEEESNKRDVKASSCKVEGVAIVFCVEPEQLEGILTEALSAYICQ